MEITLEIGIIVLALVFFGIVSALRPKISLILIFSLLPSYLIRFNIFIIPTTFLEGMILIFTIVVLVRELALKNFSTNLKKLIKKQKITLILVLLFLFVSSFAIFYSQDLRAALGVYKAYFFEPVILLFFFLYFFKEKKDFRHLLLGLSISVILVSITGIIQYLTSFGIPEDYLEPTKRATSIFPYPAAFALYLVPFMVVFSVLLLKKKVFERSLYYLLGISTAVGFVGLLLSRAEGGIAAYLLAMFFFGLLTKYRWYILGISLILFIVVFSVPFSRDYLLPVLTFQDVSGEVRLALFEGTYNLLKDRPFLGAGLASFPQIYEQYKLARHTELLLYPHNIFLAFWVEVGLLGLLSFISLLVYFFKRVFCFIRKNKADSWNYFLVLAALSAMISILVYGLVDVPYFKNDLAILFFLVFGMGVIVKRE